MKRLAILFSLAVLLGGCIAVPYGSDGEGAHGDRGGDWHGHRDDRGGERREGHHDDRGGSGY
ncbi:hypothetical protein [Paraherbaspirillum soli]|uniref:Lipoprotein n=1 Tax=Paraherbaspirillum soli TaxID=631222 RepID=A0ABW0MA42_9BURK